MPEKRVRAGSGIRPRRKPKSQDIESNDRLVQQRTTVDPSLMNTAVSVADNSDVLEQGGLASVFQKVSAPSKPSSIAPNSGTVVSPPPIPKFSDIKVSSPIELKSKRDPSEPFRLAANDFEVGSPESVLEAQVAAIEGIDEATGNYLLTLGYPGSGKTVLQSFIYYYIATDGAFLGSVESQRDGSHPNYLTQSLLNKWVKDWSDQKFPDATRESVDAIREVRLKLTPKINPSKSFNFSFVEVSGELIKSLVPTEVQAGSIVETMHNFLTAPKSKKIIVYVFDHNVGSNNDELFSSLIQYLESTGLRKLDKSYSLLIVVPNPDLVLQYISSDERLRKNYTNMNELTPEAMLHYLRVKAPQMVTTYRSWDKSKRGIFKFHIGPVFENALGEKILENFDFKDSSRIINFCYQQFHGARLKETWLARFIRVLRN